MIKKKKKRSIRQQLILLTVGLVATLWLSLSLRDVKTDENSILTLLTGPPTPSRQITLNLCQGFTKATALDGRTPVKIKDLCQVPITPLKTSIPHPNWLPLLTFWTEKGSQTPLEGLKHQGKVLYRWKRVQFYSPRLDQILSVELTLL